MNSGNVLCEALWLETLVLAIPIGTSTIIPAVMRMQSRISLLNKSKDKPWLHSVNSHCLHSSLTHSTANNFPTTDEYASLASAYQLAAHRAEFGLTCFAQKTSVCPLALPSSCYATTEQELGTGRAVVRQVAATGNRSGASSMLLHATRNHA